MRGNGTHANGFEQQRLDRRGNVADTPLEQPTSFAISRLSILLPVDIPRSDNRSHLGADHVQHIVSYLLLQLLNSVVQIAY